MNMVVWVSDWEMQCCGEPFKTGDFVNWTIAECKNDFPQINGIDSIDYYYDNHGTGEKSYIISGNVSKIQAIYALYELDHKKNCYIPISYKLASFDGEADGCEKSLDDYKFCAYLVQLDYKKDLVAL